jgi:hypothetical protein
MGDRVYQGSKLNSRKQNAYSNTNAQEMPQSDVSKICDMIINLSDKVNGFQTELENIKGSVRNTNTLVQHQIDQASLSKTQSSDLIKSYDSKVEQWNLFKNMISQAAEHVWPEIARADFKDLIKLR